MINQLQHHFVIALWAKQRIFTEAVKEPFLKRLIRQNSVASGVNRHLGRDNFLQAFSGLLVTHISMEAVITDSMKPFWQDMLDHSSHELEYREGFMLNLFSFMVVIPVADRFAVIFFDPSEGDRGGNDIFSQIFSQSLPTGGYISRLKVSDKAFGVIFPSPVNVWLNGRIRNFFSEHFEKVILPFFVHHFVRDVRDVFPLFPRINSPGGHKDVKMGVVMAGPSCSLQDNHGSYIEFFPGARFENVFEAGMTSFHQGAEQCGITIKPDSQRLRHRQDHMAIGNARQKTSSDEIGPTVSINGGARETKAGFAGKGNATRLAAMAASILDIAHLLRIAAVEHFLDSFIHVRTIKA